MLTQEQIKSLKPGDPLIIHGSFKKTYNDGDIIIWRRMIDGGILSDIPTYVHPSCVSLPSEPGTSVPTPKYDPTRLFRKGDIVRLKEWNGRCPALPEDWKFNNGLFKVQEDEKLNSSVEITRENLRAVYIVPICFIELVTPVKEQEPFYLDEITDEDEDGEPYHCFMVKTMKGEDRVRTYYSNKFETIEQTKAAAEAECKRLNEEWRKEHE
jgi:hypothetical protein